MRWQNLVGVDHMVSHWEWTLGRERVEELLGLFRGEFLSYNIVDDLFGDPLFPAYRIHRVGPYALAVVGASYPYVKVSHPESFTEGLSFALDERRLQEAVDKARAEGANAVVLLSHNGMQLDAALAERIRGIDLILSGHTHDLTPRPWRVGKTWIVAGSAAGKALMRVDLKLWKGASPTSGCGCSPFSRSTCPRPRTWRPSSRPSSLPTRTTSSPPWRSPRPSSTSGTPCTPPGTSLWGRR